MSCKPVNITPVKPKCETCRFLQIGGRYPACRYGPPTLVMVSANGYCGDGCGGTNWEPPEFESRWPEVSAGDWCGRHEPSEAVIQAARDEFNKKYGWLLGNV